MSGDKPADAAPDYLVQPTSFSSLTSKFISEEIMLIDLGESCFESFPPPKGVGTPVSYCPPELLLEGRAGQWSDVWALICTMFEMRSGFPLFESFVTSPSQVLQEMVRTLGEPPRRWWPTLEQHSILAGRDQATNGSSLGERVREIGMDDEEVCLHDCEYSLQQTAISEFHLLEQPGKGISENEANSLAGLLQRALNWIPEQRASAETIARHRWLVDD